MFVYVQKNDASIKYHYVLEKMKRDGLQMQQAAEAEQRQEAELQLHHVILKFTFGDALIIHRAFIHAVCHFSFSFLQDAFVEFLNGSYLFKNMFKDDPEADKLHYLPEVASLLHTYPLLSWFSNACRCVIDYKKISRNHSWYSLTLTYI